MAPHIQVFHHAKRVLFTDGAASSTYWPAWHPVPQHATGARSAAAKPPYSGGGLIRVRFESQDFRHNPHSSSDANDSPRRAACTQYGGRATADSSRCVLGRFSMNHSHGVCRMGSCHSFTEGSACCRHRIIQCSPLCQQDFWQFVHNSALLLGHCNVDAHKPANWVGSRNLAKFSD